MITLPSTFEDRMRLILGDEYGAFYAALQEEPPVSIRYNREKEVSMPQDNVVPWCNAAKYLPERPVFTLDPLLHGGVYYVQEASSMFMEQVVAQLPKDKPLRALDLCAAPGGKSTHLANCLPENSLLVSNEVVRNRVNILSENMTKWGNPNVVVSHNDPKDFTGLSSFFDVIVIDAPCSGEGMFRKDPQAIEEWSENNVKLCVERQRRIIGDAWEALCEEGWLVYSTCTYNREENEENVQWIMKELGAEHIGIPLQGSWGVTESDYGYRFYPHRTKGEGFFISVLRKKSGINGHYRSSSKATHLQIVKNAPSWLSGDFVIVQQDVFLQARPTLWMNEMERLKQSLRVVQTGIPFGEIKGKDIVPHTALALSTGLKADSFPTEQVSADDALHFLHRDAIKLQSKENGYHLISCQNHPLGFVKNLGTRCNNLYPNHWRIRMDIL